jgi:hypothetical protein
VDAATGGQQHDWTLRDHFAPGRLDAALNGKSLTFRPAQDSGYPGNGRGGLRIWSAGQNYTHLTTAMGLASGGWDRKIEAPVAIWSQFQTQTALWANLLEPFSAAPSPQGWDVRQDENGSAMAFQQNSLGRRFLLVRTQSEAPLPDDWGATTGFSTDAEVAAFQQRSARKGTAPFRRLLIRSGSLFVEERADIPAVLRSEQPLTLLEATWQGDTLSVHRVGGSGTVLRTFGARRLLLDGKASPIAPGQTMCRLPDT